MITEMLYEKLNNYLPNHVVSYDLTFIRIREFYTRNLCAIIEIKDNSIIMICSMAPSLKEKAFDLNDPNSISNFITHINKYVKYYRYESNTSSAQTRIQNRSTHKIE